MKRKRKGDERIRESQELTFAFQISSKPFFPIAVFEKFLLPKLNDFYTITLENILPINFLKGFNIIRSRKYEIGLIKVNALSQINNRIYYYLPAKVEKITVMSLALFVNCRITRFIN
jgi:hypothetical protein